ncbi:uncharacterized protein LOC121854949 isoform X2 [Homarus americanus]|uniref:uncharacterized protein LOC121854949 isoform X2 n=1 Tax=Homarus americanus TaxID=6706 RepID=UPI001C461A83|nr:uncharacterized protein LOC121854949 isoform X2 [Homarus americanus]
MRGESGEAIVGGGGGVVSDEVATRDGREVKGSFSPPLSAAASQVSLAPSDLTTSDPDLAGSSAYFSAASSRPPSSSQMSVITDLDLTAGSSLSSSAASSRPPSSSGLATPDLTLPAPEDYTTETVEFPTSPRALKIDRLKCNGVCFVESEEAMEGLHSATPNLLTPTYKPDELETSDNSAKQGYGFEVGSDLEEDYFEEFHLPNSHENAFVRHKSFRRKVNLTPIHAPDAEKIEGLVRTGEFQRHGSMRRKIVPEETAITTEEHNSRSKLDNNENIEEEDVGMSLSSDAVGTFARDLKEIENMLNGSEEVGENISDIVAGENFMREMSGNLTCDNAPVQLQQVIQQTNTSTPKSSSTKSSNSGAIDLNVTEDESLSIEQSTLMKVRECLDFTKYKDIYNLSGRLQDILTPKEIEEVLNNSERYSEYVNKDVIEALHNSLQEQHNNNSSGNTDSGISSPKKMISAEGLDLDNVVKTDIRAVFDDTNPKMSDSSVTPSKRSSAVFIDDDDIEEDTGFRFERRRSLRLSKEGLQDLEVEGVFIESKSQDIGLKKIKAPTLDLSASTNEECNEVPDLSNTEIINVQIVQVPDKETSNNEIQVPYTSVPVPHIVITSTCEENDKDEINVSMLLIEGSDASDMNVSPTTPETPCNFDNKSPEKERPVSLEFGSTSQRKRISVAEDILRSPIEDDTISVASAFSQRSDGEEDDCDDIKDEDFDISAFESSEPANMKYNMGLHFEPIPPPPSQLIPEMSAVEESTEERHWRSVVIAGVWRRIDMKVIAPYRKCVSHGGYLGENKNAVIVICACQLPDRSRRDYNYVMDNLFLYVLSTLEQLVADDYVLVYLAGGTPRSSMPSFHWLKRAYQMIDRKLRKNLKALHVVHPTFWVRAVVAFSRPFISTKFYRKVTFVNNLTELAQMVPLDQLNIPDAVKHHNGNRRTILALLGLTSKQPGQTLS